MHGSYEVVLILLGFVVCLFDCIFRNEESIDTHRRSRLKRYRGLPPVTPNAAVKDTVCNLVFDQIWNETVAVLQPLVALIREKASQGAHTVPSLPLVV